MGLRDECEFRDRCGTTGHYLDNSEWVRCTCLQLELNKKNLGALYSDSPEKDSPLRDMLGSNLVIEGPLEKIRKHTSSGLLRLISAHKRFQILDSYRFLEIFLQKDTEFDNQQFAVDADLLVILLGFGDPRNKYLPELLLQVVSRRELLSKATWVVLGVTLSDVGLKYSSALMDRLGTYKRVLTK